MQNYSSPAFRTPNFGPNDPMLTAKLNELSSAINRMNASVNPTESDIEDPLPTTAGQDIQNVEVVALTPVSTLSGFQVVDGRTTAANDLVLLTAQSNANQNGIWQVFSGSWVRIQNCTPMIVGVYAGTSFANTVWILTKLSPITYTMAGSPGPMQMSLVSLQTDYVQAHPFVNGSVVVGTTLNVALPYLNRRTPFDGHTVNGVSYTYSANNQRTATSGGTTENQKLTQDYYSGLIFYATVITQPVTVTIGGNATSLYLLDLNTNAHAWCHF